MLCELLLHPALAVQASHRPSYTPGLLKHGEKWDLLIALESELCPKFLQHWVLGNCLHHSIPIPAALLKEGYFASGIAVPSWAAQQKLQVLLALLERQDGHEPGHGARWAEIKTRNSLGIESKDLPGTCNSLCGRNRSQPGWRWRLKNPFWGQELGLSISQAFSCIPSQPRIPVSIRSHQD